MSEVRKMFVHWQGGKGARGGGLLVGFRDLSCGGVWRGIFLSFVVLLGSQNLAGCFVEFTGAIHDHCKRQRGSSGGLWRRPLSVRTGRGRA